MASILSGIFGNANKAEDLVENLNPKSPHDYGVDVSTQIHGRLSRHTFQVSYLNSVIEYHYLNLY